MPEEMPDSKSEEPALREEEIARLAYRYYEEEGFPDGRAEEHWRRAEQDFQGPLPPWTVESGAGA